MRKHIRERIRKAHERTASPSEDVVLRRFLTVTKARRRSSGIIVEIHGETFELTKSSEGPAEPRFLVRYKDKDIGSIESYVPEWRTRRWRFIDGTGTHIGSAGQAKDAVWGLFDRFVQEPMRKVAEAGRETIAP